MLLTASANTLPRALSSPQASSGNAGTQRLRAGARAEASKILPSVICSSYVACGSALGTRRLSYRLARGRIKEEAPDYNKFSDAGCGIETF